MYESSCVIKEFISTYQTAPVSIIKQWLKNDGNTSVQGIFLEPSVLSSDLWGNKH